MCFINQAKIRDNSRLHEKVNAMNSATKILDVAERRMRKAGYNAVSYRDIAGEIGIKSASLHYHFARKEDLGVALVKRYSENFYSHLDAATADLKTPQDRITAFVGVYRFALEQQELVCLCAVLGAEAPGLPAPVTEQVRGFFESNIEWLTGNYEALNSDTPETIAKTTLALLEGAMIVASVNDDMGVFEAAAELIAGGLAKH